MKMTPRCTGSIAVDVGQRQDQRHDDDDRREDVHHRADQQQEDVQREQEQRSASSMCACVHSISCVGTAR